MLWSRRDIKVIFDSEEQSQQLRSESITIHYHHRDKIIYRQSSSLLSTINECKLNETEWNRQMECKEKRERETMEII